MFAPLSWNLSVLPVRTRRRCWAEPDQKGKEKGQSMQEADNRAMHNTAEWWSSTHTRASEHILHSCTSNLISFFLFSFVFFFFFCTVALYFPPSARWRQEGVILSIYIFIYILRNITSGNVSSIFNRIWVVLDYPPSPPPPLTVSDHSSYDQSVYVIFLPSFWLL